ncbi:MAG TPA: YtxH domain-containing protein [Bacteroidota bacterium]|nr:YtxH domain-containing protein [Bacteroidota bacterium]
MTRVRNDSRKSTSKKIVKPNGKGSSGFAKGLFVGGLLGTAAAWLYTPKSGTKLRVEIPREGVRSEKRNRPLSTTRVEQIVETGKPVKPAAGWRVMYYVASAVALISNFRMKK